MSVIVYGYERSVSYGHSAGISLPNSVRTTIISPKNARILGGEELTIMLPCLPKNNETFLVKCMFNPNTIIDGYHLGIGRVGCITPTFSEIGPHSIFISLNNGTSFPYNGNIYVADQDILTHQIEATPEKNNIVIDFRDIQDITLKWNSTLFSSSILTLKIFYVKDPIATKFEWDNNTILYSNVPNTGSMTINLGDISQSKRQEIGDRVTVGTYMLIDGNTMDKQVYITGKRATVINIADPLFTNGNGICGAFSTLLQNTPTNIVACPCTVQQANADSYFLENNDFISIFHPDTDRCFRSAPTMTGSCQECCYNTDGNINIGTNSSGSANTYCPEGIEGTLRHQINDVLPWWACCELSSNCDLYKQNRPSDDCTAYQPSSPGWSWGDPHYRSFDGLEISFNGVGEFSLITSSLHNFTIQARMAELDNASVSVFTGFAIQADNTSKFQIQRTVSNEAKIYLGDDTFVVEHGILSKYQSQGISIEISQDLTEIAVKLITAGISLKIHIYPNSMACFVPLENRFRGKVEGLLGNFNGEIADDLMSPNGTYIPSSSSLSEIYYNFGLAWRININDSLFTYQFPFTYDTYNDLNFVPILQIPNVTQVSDEIRQLCGDDIPCIFDAIASGSLEFANETVKFSRMAESIVFDTKSIVSCGYPGPILNGFINGSGYLEGNMIEIICNEGYRLNVTTDPPYQYTTNVSCGLNGNWSAYIPYCIHVIPTCVQSTNVHYLNTFSPKALRVLGGERISITLPCLPQITNFTEALVKCKFGSLDENGIEVNGYPLGIGNIECNTSPFSRIASQSFYVSLDNGTNYIFHGSIYVADQETLPPQISLTQNDGIIDFRTEQDTIITWNSTLFNSSFLTLKLFTVVDPLASTFAWDDSIILVNDVQNSGLLTVDLSKYILANILTIGTLLLCANTIGANQQVYITGKRSVVINYESIGGDSGICDTFLPRLQIVPTHTMPCPCTLLQANADINYVESSEVVSTINSGTVRCFRSAPSTSGSCQECCYNSEGNIDIGTPSSGTAKTYCPEGIEGTLLHQIYDVLPKFACCDLSSNCEIYTQNRPSDDCRNYQPSSPGVAAGDPHYTTFDGLKYDFNGIGEFTLVTSSLFNFTIQGRMARWRYNSASVYTGFAMQAENASRFQIQRTTSDKAIIFLNDDTVILEQGILLRYIYPGLSVDISRNLRDIDIRYIESGISIKLTIYSTYMNCLLPLDNRFRGKIEGMLGNFNGEITDDLMTPNGSYIPSTSSTREIHYNFGLLWRVPPNDSLFTYQNSFDYNSYSDTSFVPIFEIPDITEVSPEIRNVCGDSLACTFDAFATGSLELASETVQFETMVEEIVSDTVAVVSCGYPGPILHGSINGASYLAGSVIEIRCNEGYRLDKPTNILPPYEDRSVLTCDMNGNWSSSIPSCIPILFPPCPTTSQPHSNSYSISDVTPRNVRVLGGEAISIALPCLPLYLNISALPVKCRLGSPSEIVTEVYGNHIEPGKVECITRPYARIGPLLLYVSLDNGTTFPYHGSVYVADQETLHPRIALTSELNNAGIDFRIEQYTTLTWNSTLFNSSPLTMKLFLVVDPRASTLVWDNSIVLDTNVQNIGLIRVDFSKYAITTDLLTIGTISLSKRTSGISEIYITGKQDVIINSAQAQFIGDDSNICHAFIPLLQNVPRNALSCPCTLRQASADNNYIESSEIASTINLGGTVKCFQSTPSISGSCQECCYSPNGNINIGTPSSGTPNTYCPEGIEGTLSHQIYDVLPKIACCELSSNCDTYSQYRPSDDCVRYQPTRPGWAFGDPHYTTFDGLSYDFNGIGEFTLLTSSLYNFTIQSRMEKWRYNRASVYTGFAIQADNASRFQIQRTPSDQALIFIDNDTFILEQGILPRYIYPGLYVDISQDLRNIDIRYIESGISITLTIHPTYMNCLLPLDSRFRGKVEGMLGNFNGDYADDLRSPNGSYIPHTSSIRDIHYNFGLSWRIPPNDSLFTYQPSFDYDSYSDSTFEPIFEIPDITEVSPEIQNVCGDSFACLFDAVATGSLEFANETVQFETMVEEIVSDTVAVVSCGYPGPILHGSINASSYLAGSVIEIRCNEGYRLDKPTNILPPYEDRSVLTCDMNGNWSSSIPSCIPILIPACTYTHTLSNISPRNVRILGGEELYIPLPCLPLYFNTTTSLVKCKFGSISESNTQLNGHHIELGIVGCITSQFSQIGPNPVYVSIDNGTTYPYSGSVYVADQDTLQPQIAFIPEHYNERLDFSIEQNITLTWNRTLINSSLLALRLFKVKDSRASTLVWDDSTILKTNIQNLGVFELDLSNLNIANDLLTVGTFSLTPDTNTLKDKIYITGKLAVIINFIEPHLIASNNICQTFLPRLQTVPRNTLPCPCTLRQANADSNYVESTSTINSGTVRCFRSAPSMSGSCQECCYSSDGNINIGTTSSGTANAYCPGAREGTLLHQIHDVLPKIACCELSSNCDTYSQYRPSDDCVHYHPTRPGWAWGDPHYTTFDGLSYDFNGIGEYFLLKSSVYNFTIQGRMARWNSYSLASVYTGFAMQAENASRFQVQRTPSDQAIIFIADDTFILEQGILLRYIYPGLLVDISKNLRDITIRYVESGITIRLTIESTYMNCLLPLDNRFRGNVEGMLGNFNGDLADELRGPNGSYIPSTSSTREIHYNFGSLWRVTFNDSLFTYQPSLDYNSYNNPNFVPIFEIPTEVSPEIRNVCGDSLACTFDAFATGSLELASETAQFETMVEEIVSDTVAVVSCGYPGPILHGSINASSYLADSVIEIRCNEGYRLDKPTNILPPYEDRSVLTCDMIGNWSSSIPSCIPILILACTNTHTLSNISPRNVRVLGGEVLSIPLPCLPPYFNISTSVVKCRFHFEGNFVVVNGYHIELGKVGCVTVPSSRIGLLSLQISINNGTSYPYHGSVYVADQQTLQPRIQLTPDEANHLLDFRLNQNITLTWNQTLLIPSTLTLKLILVQNPEDNTPVWDDMVLLNNVQNTGELTIDTTTLTFAANLLTVGTFSLSSSNNGTYITGKRAIIVNFDEPQSIGPFGPIGPIGGSDICQTFQPRLQTIPGNTPPCPCTSRQANADTNYVESSQLASTTVRCFRSIPSITGSCQECCYNPDGNIDIGTTSSGTANTYCPESMQGTLLHQIYDVLPRFACCVLTSNCDTYTQNRPSDDCRNYRPSKPGLAAGDPHYTTFDGLYYDFNAVGEFTLLSSSLYNFTIQGRMERWHPNSRASVYTGFAMQAKNASRFQIQRTASNQVIIYLDEDTFILETGILLRYIYPGLSIDISHDLREITIRYIESGITIQLSIYSSYMNCLLPVDNRFRGKLQGMLGNFNGDLLDDLRLPNGSYIPSTSSTREIHYNFGLLWRVSSNDSLFTYQPIFDYESYSEPTFEPIFEIPDIISVSQEIQDICGASFPCLFDAVATGSLELANETLQFETMAQEIISDTLAVVSCGYPGPISHGSINGSVYLAGSVIEIICDEGYRLNETGNFLPPYEDRSVLTCGMNGQWNPLIPSCISILVPACTTNSQYNPYTHSLANIFPRNVRVLGGEVLSITLPCLPHYLDLNISLVKCRLGDLDESHTVVNGHHLDLGKVGCVTSPFSRIGLHPLYVSVDNGTTYIYDGNVYVADQESLLPQILVTPVEYNTIIDIRAEENITLTWNETVFNSSFLTLKLFVIKDPLSNTLQWDDSTVLASHVQNTGHLTIHMSTIIDSAALTLGTFLLTPNTNYPKGIYITGERAIILNTTSLSDAAGNDVCRKFIPRLENVPRNTLVCPCTLRQANADSNFVRQIILDVVNCFRSTISSSGSCQECCYNSDGNINIGTPSSGTPNTYCPGGIEGTLSHQIYDVLPRIACCELSSNCDTYSQYRPSDDCVRYQPTRPGWAFGDPHYTTFDGLSYDFNGIGEFTLLTSSLYNFTIQSRMEKWRYNRASVYTGFAIQADNASRFQIQRTPSDQALIFIDNDTFILEQGILPRYIYPGLYVDISQDLRNIDIRYIESGISITLTIHPTYMNCLLPLDSRFRGKVEGMLGNFNGDYADDLRSPNGSYIPHTSSIRDIHYNFGLSWRIPPNDSLFTYQPSFDYDSYSDSTFEPIFEIPDITEVSPEIQNVCGDSFACLFDAVATGSLEFANETVQFETMVEEIVSDTVAVVSCGYPGPILHGSINASSYLAGSVIEIRCNEGYRLDKPTNILPPYEDRSVLTCDMNGNWSSSIPSCIPILIPACTYTHTLSNISPRNVRILGGEELYIPLPCLPLYFNTTTSLVKCKFGSISESNTQLNGHHIELGIVGCITSQFSQIGPNPVYVSIDNGTTYPYSGSVYVADQDTLQPQIAFIPEHYNERLDFSIEQNITLTWNRTLINSSLLALRLFKVKDSRASTLVWDDSTILKTNIQNLGVFELDLSNLNIANDLLTVGTFSLTPDTNTLKDKIYITGKLAVIINFIEPHLIASNNICQTFLPRLQTVPRNTLPCPCTLRQANADSNYVESTSTINSGTVRCFRSAPSMSGSCQECCYSSDGNINIGTTSSGTANAYCPGAREGTLLHQIHDVLPKIACCELSSNCDTYSQYRPSDDCVHYHPTRPGWAWGDPHYTTFDGLSYDFNGIGEYFLLKSSVYNFTIQGRMARWNSYSLASVYTGFAMQAENASRFQVQRTPSDQAIIFIADDTFILEQGILLRYIYPGLLVDISKNLRDITIRYVESGITIRLTIESTYMNCLLPLDNRFRGNVEGMLGNFNGDLADELRGPNGSYIPSTSSTREIHYNFGSLWRVTFNDSLFTYQPSLDYNSYNNPNFVPIFEIPTEVSPEIRNVCGDSLACTFDAFATGSLELASETAQFETMVEEIVSDTVAVVSCGYPGPILHGSINASSYLADSVIEIRCNEGYRLDKPTNILPPYEDRSVLTCDMIGNWSSSIPSCIPILILACTNTHTLSNISPRNVRVLGGEVLSIPLPCLPPYFNISTSVVKCRFHFEGNFVVVNGYHIELGKVGCVTVPSSRIGLLSLQISINNGTSYPYHGSVYVADQQTLQPRIQLTPDEANHLLDFRLNQNITLTWNQTLFTHSTLTLKLLLVQNPEDNTPVWDDMVLLNNVQNTGELIIDTTTLTFATNLLTVGTFSLSSTNNGAYITGRRAIIVNFDEPQSIGPFGPIGGSDICQTFQPRLQTIPGNTLPCPCTLRQANADTNYVESSQLASTTVRCFRSIPSITGSCQECCYNPDGNIDIGTISSGTANTYCPESMQGTLLHQIYDVLPRFACCVLTSNCDTYTQNRPSDDCRNYRPSKPGLAAGDPHYTTFDGLYYDFNAVGEFTLLSSSLYNFTIQGRMARWHPNSRASVYTGFAMQARNASRFQIQRTASDQAIIYLDEDTFILETGILLRYIYPGLSIDISHDLREITIRYIESGITIQLSIYSSYMNCLLPVDNRFRGKLQGMLGNFNGDLLDDLRLPNGTYIPSASSTREIHYNFGLLWRVSPNDSLFTYQPSFDYESYSELTFVPIFEIPDITSVSQEIQDICGVSYPCRFDAVATGSLELANETLQFETMAQEIISDTLAVVSCGYPGPISHGSINGSVYLAGSVIEIICDEGYRLNETGNFLPPYEDRSVLTCDMNGQWNPLIPSCISILVPACTTNSQYNPYTHSLANIFPRNVRVLGGEVLSITLPCLPHYLNLNTSLVKCRFSGLDESHTVVNGYHLDLGKVGCVTSPFSRIGLHPLYVSVDNGTTYIYDGNVYVADQESLLPQILVTPVEYNTIIDLRAEENITLTWNETVFNSSFLTLKLFVIKDPLSNTLQWDDSTVLASHVQNNGHLTIHMSTIIDSALTLGTFLLTPNTNYPKGIYITGERAIIINTTSLSDAAGNDVCRKFIPRLENVPRNTLVCPCTLRQANADSNFVKQIIPDVVNCFRSTISSSGSCQECCYNSDGNINIGTPSSGTPNTYCPGGIEGTLSHQIYDVLPKIACCELSSNCDTYFQYRPSDDCVRYQPTRPGWAWGDPHYTTFDGLSYDFNGIGEFTLVSSTLYNFTIQGRMSRWKHSPASVYTGFAIQADNASRFQIQRTASNEVIIYLDEDTFMLEPGILLRHIYQGVSVEISPNLLNIDIRYAESRISIRLTIHSEYMNCLLPLDGRFRGQVIGMLGNFNGDLVDDLRLPNGSYIPHTSSTREIHYNFGLLWRIPSNASLFTYQPSFTYDSYSNPDFIPIFEIPDITEISPEIRELCGESASCLFDAVATGSLEFANETRQFETIAQEIVTDTVSVVSCGYPGSILHGSINGTVYLAGKIIEVICDEGYKLNKTDNDIPPYEDRSLLSCGMNGQWSTAIPTCVLILIPACVTPAQSNFNTLSVITPKNVRVLGGETLTIDLPCLPHLMNASSSLIKCRFEALTEVNGYQIELGKVGCPTSPFSKIGLHSVYVSLNNGTTYPFLGNVYVADEQSLPPQISVSPDVSDVIDFRFQQRNTLSWDKALFNSSTLRLKLFLLRDPLSIDIEWDDSIVLNGTVENSGSLTINLKPRNLERLLTIGTFMLTDGTPKRYITGKLSIILNTIEQPSVDEDVCGNFLPLPQNLPVNQIPCPCTTGQANVDINFIEAIANIPSPMMHYRSTPSISGSGQQCLYNSDGNINVGTGSSGTVDTHSPEGIEGRMDHLIHDELPWWACCNITSNCAIYQQYRPSDDCSNYQPPTFAWAFGDPHFRSLDGIEFTFNGAGEFILVKSSIHKFTLQARMEIFKNSQASVLTGFAIQTENSSKIQIQRTFSGQTIIYSDDEYFVLGEGIFLRYFYQGVTIQISEELTQIDVRFSVGSFVRIYIYPESLSYFLQLSDSFKGNVYGILGNFNGNGNDDFMLPNGSVIPINSTLTQIHYNFGLKWRINEKDSLFTYQAPFNYSSYDNPGFMPILEIPDENQVSSEVRQICGDSLSCLFDATTTGSLSFANETATFTKITENVRANSVKIVSCGYPGSISNGSINGSVFFSDSIIEITCEDGFILNSTSNMVPYVKKLILTCGQDGQWSTYVPSCVLIPIPSTRTVSLNTSSHPNLNATVLTQEVLSLKYIIIIAVITLLLILTIAVIVIVLIMVVFVCIRYKKNKNTDPPTFEGYTNELYEMVRKK